MEKNVASFKASNVTLFANKIDRNELFVKTNARFFPESTEVLKRPYYPPEEVRNIVAMRKRLSKIFGETMGYNQLKNQMSIKDIEFNPIDDIGTQSSSEEALEKKLNQTEDDDIEEEKMAKIRKGKKLSEFFGDPTATKEIVQQISQQETPLIPEAPTTKSDLWGSDEHVDKLKKKWQKLEVFLGEHVTLGSIMTQSNHTNYKLLNEDEDQDDAKLDKYVETIRNTIKLTEDSKELMELLSIFISIESQAGSSKKKISKIESMMGNDISTATLLKQIESAFIQDLEKWVRLDIGDPVGQKILSSEIEKLRKTIFSKVDEIAISHSVDLSSMQKGKE